ncbi:anthranilate synthase component I [Profundibacterium mesophilum KAUST100406-0324]|uniref:Anthranilate synthase component I n=1 Tax=Profundibacterium mesophilum KAUST100406-0324 TaxID=1037889 RepID=A0A921NVP7_9RHOB|nr:anthranilate synthase component I [Profundibacterium mesophilum KAUST100406-0324]
MFLAASPAAAGGLPEPLGPEDFEPVDPAMARIGQLLFYDKILSGNRNISCGTCHHHDLGSADALSLGIGEGGSGIGHARLAATVPEAPAIGTASRAATEVTADMPGAIRKRVPRNAPGLWNLGARQVRVMFHDGRLSRSQIYGNGFDSPAEEWLPSGLDTLLAAQALFPLIAQFEMAGNLAENEITGAVHDRPDAAWPLLAERVASIPEYRTLFAAARPETARLGGLGIVDIAQALAAFIDSEWRSFDSPFDAFLAGDCAALGPLEMRGLGIFYGRGGCDSCHSGPLFSDQEFHALGLPQFGPGRTRRFDPMPRDTGRMAETDRLEDAYRFRTPMLRNVALTAPYGHNGAYPTLRGILRHHADPRGARERWTQALARLPHAPWLAAGDFAIMDDARERQRHGMALDIAPVQLSASEIDALEAFLGSLTEKDAATRPIGRPASVPSGLSVD